MMNNNMSSLLDKAKLPQIIKTFIQEAQYAFRIGHTTIADTCIQQAVLLEEFCNRLADPKRYTNSTLLFRLCDEQKGASDLFDKLFTRVKNNALSNIAQAAERIAPDRRQPSIGYSHPPAPDRHQSSTGYSQPAPNRHQSNTGYSQPAPDRYQYDTDTTTYSQQAPDRYQSSSGYSHHPAPDRHQSSTGYRQNLGAQQQFSSTDDTTPFAPGTHLLMEDHIFSHMKLLQQVLTHLNQICMTEEAYQHDLYSVNLGRKSFPLPLATKQVPPTGLQQL